MRVVPGSWGVVQSAVLEQKTILCSSLAPLRNLKHQGYTIIVQHYTVRKDIRTEGHSVILKIFPRETISLFARFQAPPTHFEEGSPPASSFACLFCGLRGLQ